MKTCDVFRRIARWLAFAGLSALPLGTLGACGSSEKQPAAEHYFRVEEGEDGVPVAVTSWVPKYDQPLFAYEEIVQLRQDESRPESLLNRPSQFVVGEDGRYYIVDYRDGRVVIFDSEGSYAGQIGRPGDGPGEFRWPSAIWFRGGHVFVFDQRTRRTSEFGADGSYLRGFSFPWANTPVDGIYPGPDGGLMLYLTISRMNPDESRDRGNICLFLNAEGDTVATVESRLRHTPPFIEIEGTRMLMAPEPFFSPSDNLFRAPGTGAIHYNTLEPDLRLYGLDGSLVRIIHIDSPPSPVAEADRAKVVGYFRRQADTAETEEMRLANRAMLDHLTFADLMPYFQGLSVDNDGYLWLSSYPDYDLEDPYNAPPTFRVLSPEGELFGETTWPETPGYVSRGRLCILRADPDTGEITPVVYRITSAVPGFVYP